MKRTNLLSVLALLAIPAMTGCGERPLVLQPDDSRGSAENGPGPDVIVNPPDLGGDAGTGVPNPVDLAPSPPVTGGSCAAPAPLASMPDARFNVVAVAFDARIFVFGGGAEFGAFGDRTARSYDPRDGEWRSLAAMPFGFSGVGAAATDGKRIYVADLDQAAAYDPTSNEWHSIASLSRSRNNHSLIASDDGRIYSFGGLSPSGGVVAWADVYDPATNEWHELPAMPFGGEAFITARIAATGELFIASDYAGAYNPTTNSWRVIDRPHPSYWGTGASDGQRVYLVGGYSPGGPMHGNVEAFSLATEEWSALPALPMPLMQAASAIGCDGRLYVFGGDSGKLESRVLAFDPTTNAWSSSE